MSNYAPAPADRVFRINPALDFTDDTAYVAVKIPVVTGDELRDQVAVITSRRQLFPWGEDSRFGAGIIAAAGCPRLLEPRWGRESIQEFQSGAAAPDTAGIHQSVRAYLQQYLGFRHPAEYDLVALWIMGTYLKPLFKCYPILFFNAPYESGKSRCLEVISQLAFNGKWFGEITPAAFRRYSAETRPTFCLDELQEVGLKNNSTMIAILLNAYNSAEMMLTGPVGRAGWAPVLLKVTSAVAFSNIQPIKNQALQSRTISIRTEYDPRFKGNRLPDVFAPEPSQVRNELYRWLLGHWQVVREQYLAYPALDSLSAREMDTYQPLLAMADLAGPDVARAVAGYAGAVKEQKRMVQKATDDHLDLLLFIQGELAARGLGEEFPEISNRELADAYYRQTKMRLNYRRFLEMVSALQVTAEIRNRSGSKYFTFNRAEIARQLRIGEAKS